MRALSIAASLCLFCASASGGTVWNFDDGQSGIWNNTEAQAGVRLGRRGAAAKVKYDPKSTWWHRATQTTWKKSLYTVSDRSFLTFAYYATASSDMVVVLSSEKDGKSIHKTLKINKTIPQKWIYVVMYLGNATPRGTRKAKKNQLKGFGWAKNDTLKYMSIRAGSEARTKKHKFELYIDDVRYSEGISPDVKAMYSKQKKELAKYTLTMADDRALLNRNMLLSIASKVNGKTTTPKTILPVGGALATHGKFLSLARGYQKIADESVLADGITMDEVAKAMPSALAGHKPEVAAIWIGWTDFRELIGKRRAHMKLSRIGEAEAAKAPNDTKLRLAAENALDKIVSGCLEVGTVPVLLYHPPVGRLFKGEFIPATETLGYNSVVIKMAEKYQVPAIEVFSLLAPSPKARRRGRPAKGAHAKFPWLSEEEKGLAVSSYSKINPLFSKVHKALESEILRKNRAR